MRLADTMVIALLLGVALPVGAVEKGDVCKVKSPLPMVLNRPQGRIESTIDRGTQVTVLAVGDEGRSRVTTGDATGSVATRDLEAACAGTLQLCRLNDEVMLFEKTRSDSQAWRLKPGAFLSVLRTGRVWSHVRSEDLEGFVKSDEFRGRCAMETGGAVVDPAEPDVTEAVERGEGPGILFLPFVLEGAAPLNDSDEVGDLFYDRLAAYRPDAARVPLNVDRGARWKVHAESARNRARAAGFTYAMIGRTSVEDVDGKGVLVLSIALLDSKSGRILKGARVRPTTRLDDTWPETVLAALLPLTTPAPNGKAPAAPRAAQETVTEIAPAPAAVVVEAGPTPWFANATGSVFLGATIAAGVGAAVVGSMALQANDQANAASPVSDDRVSLRERALPLAIGADALGVAAVAFGITTVVVFISRAGLDD